MAGSSEIEHPGSDREGERNDRGGRRVVGNRGRKQRDRPDEHAVEQMPEQQIECFRSVEVSAERAPKDERRKDRKARQHPRGDDGSKLGPDEAEHLAGLHGKCDIGERDLVRVALRQSGNLEQGWCSNRGHFSGHLGSFGYLWWHISSLALAIFAGKTSCICRTRSCMFFL